MSRRRLRSELKPDVLFFCAFFFAFSSSSPFFLLFFTLRALLANGLKLVILYPTPNTQSLERSSLICIDVVESVSVRIFLYSTLHVRLLLKVKSTPSSGENASLMLTVDTLYIELGVEFPVVASLMNPRSFIYSIHVLYELYEPTAYTLLYEWFRFTLLKTSRNQGS